MERLRVIIASIILALCFSFFINHSMTEISMSRAGEMARQFFTLFGLLFTGIALIYSLFGLDREKIVRYFKIGGLLILIFSSLAVAISYLLVISLSHIVAPFDLQFVDKIYLTKEELSELFSLFSFFTNPETLWILICAVVGTSLSQMFKNKFSINTSLSLLIGVLNKIFVIIETIAPLPLFLLMVGFFNAFESGFTYDMFLFFATYCIAALFFILFAMPLLWTQFTKNSPLQLYRLILYPSLFAFGFGTVAAALPLLFLAIHRTNCKLNEKQRNEMAGIIIPFTYLILPLANLLLVSIPLLLFFLTGNITEAGEQLTYIAASLFLLFTPKMIGAGKMALLFDLLKLPQDATDIFIHISANLQHIHALVGSFSLGFILLFMASEKKSNHPFALKEFARHFFSLLSLLAIAYATILFAIPKLVHFPKKIEHREFYEGIVTPLIKAPINEKPLPPFERARSLREIIDSKILRVGFNADAAPFSFIDYKGNLAGFDIEMALLLAEDLGCKISFVPMSFSHITKEIVDKEYDIAVGGITLTSERIKKINFTDNTIIAEKVLIAKDYRILSFDDPKKVLNDATLRLAFLSGTSLENFAKKFFPKAIYVPIKSYDEFLKPDIADALLTTRQQAFSWSRRHPAFSIASLKKYPIPTTESLAFALNYEAKDFAQYLNHWLLIKRNEKIVDYLRRKWEIP